MRVLRDLSSLAFAGSIVALLSCTSGEGAGGEGAGGSAHGAAGGASSVAGGASSAAGAAAGGVSGTTGASAGGFSGSAASAAGYGGSAGGAGSGGGGVGGSAGGSVNVLAATPPMGWNSWNKFGCNISETLIKQVADTVVSSGMKAAGYQYVNIDDCWQTSRDANGKIVADPTNFSSGIQALADYVHGKGLKLGIYTDGGTATCQGRPGSYGHEIDDAATYASWGVDYIKEDWCNSGSEDPATQYAVMRDAIKASGRPMVLAICNGGLNAPWVWGPAIGNLWRTTDDIVDNFSGMLRNIDANQEHPTAAGRGHWNDPDMLEVGNGGLNANEDRSHFNLWAISAAPLIAGNDLGNMSAQTLTTLTNAEVIAVDQDPAGIQGQLVADNGLGAQVWSKPLATPGIRAVVLFNRGASSGSVNVRWSDIGLANGSAKARDLWQHLDLGSFQDSYSAVLASHASTMLLITGSEGSIPGTPTRYPASAAAPSVVLGGGAGLADCAACATGKKVGYVGQGGTVQFNGVKATTAGTKTIVIEYLSGDARAIQVSVNGGPQLTVQFGSSGPNYDTLGTHVLQVPLNSGGNTLAFSNPSAAAPDINSIDVFE